MSEPDLPASRTLTDIDQPVRQTDFVLVNRFNGYEAYRLGGKGFFPEHYDRIHLKFGFDPPRTEQRKVTALPSSIPNG